MLLSDRLDELGLKKEDLLRLVLESPDTGSIITTDNAANQMATVRSWLRGDRGVPREVFELMASQSPTETEFLDRVNLLDRLSEDGPRTTTLALKLALRLDRGLDDPPEPTKNKKELPTGSTSDPRRIWEWATQLLNTAATQKKAGAILIDARGFEAVFDQASPGAAAGEWRRALWRAIRAGWHVRHVLSWGPGGTPLSDSVQAELVVNLLYSAATRARGARRYYEPIICSKTPPGNVIAVQGIGSLAFWQHPSADKRYASWQSPSGLTSFMVSGAGPIGQRFTIPTVAYSNDAYTELRFDMALAAAESDPQAEHCMVKSGLPAVHLPPAIAKVQEDTWRRARPAEKPYVYLTQVVRERRRRSFRDITRRGKYRDIITKEGVREYLRPDPPEQQSPGDARYGPRYLPIAHKIAHARAVADAVDENPGYKLALVDRRELLLGVDRDWWAATRGQEHDSWAVFFIATRWEGDQVQGRLGWLADSGSTNTVDAFFDLFDLMWRMLPATATDRVHVARQLRAFADEADGKANGLS